MPVYTLKKIAEMIGGECIQSAGLNWQSVEIRFLSTDSRTLLSGAETLFFALRSERNDGHRYIADLYNKQVRAFVVNELPGRLDAYPDAFFIQVEDVLKALQKLAAKHRETFTAPVLGITGSNGKTIVKEWLFELLQQEINIVRSPKSYNSQIGVPLSLWLLEPDHELAIIEAGISLPGEMQKLERMIHPQIGIFTTITGAHQENFKNNEEKIREKLELFKKSEKLIYCRDHEEIHHEILKYPFQKTIKLISWSTQFSGADLYVPSIISTLQGVKIEALYKDDWFEIEIPFQDEASIENALHCLTFILSGYEEKAFNFLSRFSQLEPVAMRLEIKKGINHCTLINDSYNSDINSLRIATNCLDAQAANTGLRKIVILSDILQSGITPQELYKEVDRILTNRKIDRMIGVGPALYRYQGVFSTENAMFFEDTHDFLEQFSETSFRDEIILIKGARQFHFDAIASRLQEKAHQTVLEVNLNALVHNLNFFRNKLEPGVKMMAMVKAFSYGSGSVEIARVLEYQRVDYLAVAIADEGVELRKAGIRIPIVVMNPEAHSFDTMIEFRLEPNIYSLSLLRRFHHAARKNAIRNFPIHVKIDTGMKRLGFDSAEEIRHMIELIKSEQALYVASVFSHLAVSDDPDQNAFTQEQFKRFEELSALLLSDFEHPILRHILNSAGIERFPDHQYDMVRLGIGLYGISAVEAPGTLKCVSTLKTTISQIREVKAGETISYGRRGSLLHDSRIAILPIGYADGLNRRLSNGVGEVLVNGKKAPFIGTICMDMCMIDLTGIDAKEGDSVILFGEQISIEKMAEALETIPYEILTGISQRVKRVYYQE